MNTKITTILAIIGVALGSCAKEESTPNAPLSGGFYEGKVKSINIVYNDAITEEQVGTTLYPIISNDEGLIPDDVTYTYLYDEEGIISSIAVDKEGKEERYTYSYPTDRSIRINYYKDDFGYPEDVYDLMLTTTDEGYDLVEFYRAEKNRRNCIMTYSSSKVSQGREYITIGSWYAHNSQYDVTWSSTYNITAVERGDGTDLTYTYTSGTGYTNSYSVDINEMTVNMGAGGYLVDGVAAPALRGQIGTATAYSGTWSQYLVSAVSETNTGDLIYALTYTLDEETSSYITSIAVSTYEILAEEGVDDDGEVTYTYYQSAITYATVTIEYYTTEVEEDEDDEDEDDSTDE